jgi:threonine dehydrogenase-like Zn-dependent dehydrogenase
MNRSDMCLTGEYTERGIKGMDGYQTEFVVDHEQYIVQVPPDLGTLGVLTEPLSVVEKAIDETVNIQLARLPDAMATPDWLFGRICLIAGLGPIGLLAALALRLRGAQIYGLDVVDPGTNRPCWLEAIGGKYIDGRKVNPQAVTTMTGGIEFILEATGVPSLEFNLLEALARNGAYVLTGIPGGDRPLQIHGALLMRQLVLDNQVMFGSVNAARDHYQMAVDDLRQATHLWPGQINQLITNRFPYTDFMTAFKGHTPDEIKVVLEWSQPNDR